VRRRLASARKGRRTGRGRRTRRDRRARNVAGHEVHLL
jgi:hypothetical protein